METGERSWYVASPREPAPTVAGDTSAVTTPLIASAPVPDSLADASSVAPTPGILKACAHIQREDLIRVQSDFGRFEGFAAVVGPHGMEGMRGDWERGQHSAVAVPDLVTWDRIDAVDKHGRGWRKGAVLGGMVLGVYGGLVGYVIGTEGIGEPSSLPPAEAAGAAVGGVVIGGAIGAVLGAGVGWLFPAWLHVYVAPER
jgi:hypothetical protein